MSTWDDKPNDYEHAVKLIDQRNTIIEECAQLVERECYDHDEAVRLAALIRALKDKP